MERRREGNKLRRLTREDSVNDDIGLLEKPPFVRGNEEDAARLRVSSDKGEL